MKLEVLRISSQVDSTSGLLFDISNNKRKFLCYTLEDESREEKVWGETCIPSGEYCLGLRTVGGLDARYSKRFADIHMGMLHVLDVPNFKYILIAVILTKILLDVCSWVILKKTTSSKKTGL